MTRAEEFELAVSQRHRADEVARRGAHAQYRAAQRSIRPARQRQPEPLDTLNAAFARIRRETVA